MSSEKKPSDEDRANIEDESPLKHKTPSEQSLHVQLPPNESVASKEEDLSPSPKPEEKPEGSPSSFSPKSTDGPINLISSEIKTNKKS